jgi:hypothetical protein
MTISFPPIAQSTGPDVVTSALASSTAANIMAANANRAPGSFIINNGTKIMWVTESGSAATPAAPSIPVPANGGVFDLAGNYSGAVSAAWVAGATGSASIHEFSYV